MYLIFYYATLLYQPIEQIREELENLQQAEANILRIQDLLQMQSYISPGDSQLLPGSALSVNFENVWFSYESSIIRHWSFVSDNQPMTMDERQWTLQNLSFGLPAGQTLGILGRTGSGKTTLIRLLLRLYEPQIGRICLGNVPIDQTPLTELRQRVGLVTCSDELY